MGGYEGFQGGMTYGGYMGTEVNTEYTAPHRTAPHYRSLHSDEPDSDGPYAQVSNVAWAFAVRDIQDIKLYNTLAFRACQIMERGPCKPQFISMLVRRWW